VEEEGDEHEGLVGLLQGAATEGGCVGQAA
jgi:hypothetical protein